jgi:hypothetical protein
LIVWDAISFSGSNAKSLMLTDAADFSTHQAGDAQPERSTVPDGEHLIVHFVGKDRLLVESVGEPNWSASVPVLPNVSAQFSP